MQRLTPAVAATLTWVGALFGPTAHAAVQTYYISGTTSTSSFDTIPANTPFTGSYTFDDAVSDTNADADTGEFATGQFTIELPTLPATITTTGAGISITNDGFNFGFGTADRFTIRPVAGTVVGIANAVNWTQSNFGFADSGDPSADALTGPPFDQFSSVTHVAGAPWNDGQLIVINFSAVEGGCAPFSSSCYTTFAISSLTDVEPLPSLTASKVDAISQLDGDSALDFGETLGYTVVLTNNGTADATGVMFSDAPDANTSLVVGSVTTSQGAVVTGNTGGDTAVEVDVGTIASGGGSVTITFDVELAPSIGGGTEVINQGQVTANELGQTLPTDDPDDATGTEDPTRTPVDPQVVDAGVRGVPVGGPLVAALLALLLGISAVFGFRRR